MLYNLPPLNWLRAFEASARHLSFTSAARELNVTQAAVSQKVKALERHLGQQLFHRLPRSLKLTATGEAYLPSVRDGFIRLAEGTSEVFGPAHAESLTIRVSATFAATWLGRHLPQFQAAHPDISLRIVTAVWPDDHDWAGVDLDVRFGNGQWPNAQLEKLTNEQFFMVCAPELFDGRTPPQSFDDLGAHTVYHVSSHSNLWPRWLEAVDSSAAAITDSTSILVDTWALAVEAAAGGGGLTLCFSSLWEHYAASNVLIRPFDLETEIGESYYLATPPNHTWRAEAVVFADWLRDSFGAC